MKVEKRSLNLDQAKVETRADGTGGITGYAAVFWNGDARNQFELCKGYMERIHPGAFDSALKENDVRALFNHDTNMVLGRTKSGTLKLSTDAHGLRYDIDIPDTQAGRDVLALIKRGDISGSSFSFETLKEDPSKEDGAYVRNIRSVKLYDVGPVTFPAYEATDASARSLELASLLEELEPKPKVPRDPIRTRARVIDITNR